MSNPVTVEVDNLTYRYRTREQPALKASTFQATAGQITLIAGASGCGKTTLIRCINGLIPRSYTGGELSGTLRIKGRDPLALPMAELSQMVGTVLQDPEKQIVGSSVLTEVAFGLENLGLPRHEIMARVRETLDFLGIEHLLTRDTVSLSGGEKQKVAVAGILAMAPDIILLDEPLANLDPLSMEETLGLIRRLADMGKTILVIEHRVEDVLDILKPHDQALFLEAGEQRYCGDIAGFLERVNPIDVKLPARLALRKLLGPQANSLLARPTLGSPSRAAARPGYATALLRQAEPLVSFDRVSFGYDQDELILKDINLDIYPGDIVALLGPNGAGKTTFLKHTIGLLRPTRGEVRLDGDRTRSLSVAQMAKTVGYVFQNPSHMLFAPTVREELSFGPRNMGMRPARIEANVAASLRIVDLEAHETDAPLALSFGQQRRVGLGAVLAMESKILALDEPTAGQDLKHYAQFMDAIIAMPFKAILFITHDVDLAIRYANRVILFVDGQILADGPPESVLADRERLRRARLKPTSLLDLNLALLSRTGTFTGVDTLAQLLNPSAYPAT